MGIEVDEEGELDKGLRDIVELFDWWEWEHLEGEKCSKETKTWTGGFANKRNAFQLTWNFGQTKARKGEERSS